MSDKNKRSGRNRAYQRTASLTNVLDMSGMTFIEPEKTSATPHPSISFHNFKVVPFVSQKSSNLHELHSFENAPTLKKIYDVFPSISPQNKQLEGFISPILSKMAKKIDSDLLFYHSIRKPSKLTHYHKQSPSIDEKTVLEMKQKLGLGRETNRVEYIDSIKETPKKHIENKLSLKRKALNQNVREAYHSIVNSKDHGSYKEIASKIAEAKSANVSFVNAKDKSQKLELKVLDRYDEDDQTGEDIKNRGIRDFRKRIAMYNITKDNYLVPPDSRDRTFQRKRIGSLPKLLETPQRNNEMVNVFNPMKSVQPEKITFHHNFGNLGKLKKSGVSQSQKMMKPMYASMLSNSNIQENESFLQSTEKKVMSRLRREQSVSSRPNDKNEEENVNKMRHLEEKIPRRKMLRMEEELVFKAVKEGNEMELTSLIQKNPDLVNIADNRGETPLHWAIKRQYLNLVMLLCKSGADFEAVDMVNRKPMDVAERLGSFDIVEFLAMFLKKKNGTAS